MMANHFTVKAEHLTTLLGQMTWLVASSTGLHLAFVLDTKKVLAKTKVLRDGVIDTHAKSTDTILDLGEALDGGATLGVNNAILRQTEGQGRVR